MSAESPVCGVAAHKSVAAHRRRTRTGAGSCCTTERQHEALCIGSSRWPAPSASFLRRSAFGRSRNVPSSLATASLLVLAREMRCKEAKKAPWGRRAAGRLAAAGDSPAAAAVDMLWPALQRADKAAAVVMASKQMREPAAAGTTRGTAAAPHARSSRWACRRRGSPASPPWPCEHPPPSQTPPTPAARAGSGGVGQASSRNDEPAAGSLACCWFPGALAPHGSKQPSGRPTAHLAAQPVGAPRNHIQDVAKLAEDAAHRLLEVCAAGTQGRAGG